MKSLFPFVMLAALSVFSCGTNEPATRPDDPDRPDGTETAAEPRFAAGTSSTAYIGREEGAIHLIIYRECDNSAPEASYGVDASGHEGFAKPDGRVTFAAGKGETSLRVGYTPGALGTAGTRSVRLALSGTKAEHSVTFVKRAEAEWTDAGSCVLYDSGRCRRCTRQTAKRGEATEYRAVDADGRTLLGYSISASGAATPMAAGGYLPAADCAGASPMPAYAADSHASPHMAALNVCSVSEDGAISEPRAVYLIDGERFDERFVSVTVTEGWLSPAVWLDARPPAQGRSWDCLGEIAEGGSLLVYDPYRNSSPFNMLNAAPCASAWQISYSGEGAEMAPQFSGFTNRDLFPSKFMIEARNGLYEAQKDGFRLEWELPGHNCLPGGGMSTSTDCIWAEVWPTVLYISSIKAI